MCVCVCVCVCVCGGVCVCRVFVLCEIVCVWCVRGGRDMCVWGCCVCVCVCLCVYVCMYVCLYMGVSAPYLVELVLLLLLQEVLVLLLHDELLEGLGTLRQWRRLGATQGPVQRERVHRSP